MESPPPLPPLSPPPVPVEPVRRKGGLSGWAIAGLVSAGVLGVIILLAAMIMPMYFKLREIALEPPRQRPLKSSELPLTQAEKAEAEAFVKKLLQAVEKRDTVTIQECTDHEALARVICDGFPEEQHLRAAMAVDMSRSPGGAFSHEVMGLPGRLVRQEPRDEMPAATLRFTTARGGAFYCDVLLRRVEGGGFKVHDMFHYVLGVRLSRELHEIEFAVWMGTNEDALKRMRGSKAEIDEKMAERGMASAFRGGRWREVITFYDTLSSDTKNRTHNFWLYVKALQKLHEVHQEEYEERYVAALDWGRLVLSCRASSDQVLLDRHILRKDFAAAREAAELSLMAVGEDSHLLVLRGIACVHTNDLKAARKSLKGAEKMEPDLASLVDLRLMIRAAEKDYAGVVAAIQVFESRTGSAMPPDRLDDAIFDEFKKSAEFAEWSGTAGKKAP